MYNALQTDKQRDAERAISRARDYRRRQARAWKRRGQEAYARGDDVVARNIAEMLLQPPYNGMGIY